MIHCILNLSSVPCHLHSFFHQMRVGMIELSFHTLKIIICIVHVCHDDVLLENNIEI